MGDDAFDDVIKNDEDDNSCNDDEGENKVGMVVTSDLGGVIRWVGLAEHFITAGLHS